MPAAAPAASTAANPFQGFPPTAMKSIQNAIDNNDPWIGTPNSVVARLEHLRSSGVQVPPLTGGHTSFWLNQGGVYSPQDPTGQGSGVARPSRDSMSPAPPGTNPNRPQDYTTDAKGNVVNLRAQRAQNGPPSTLGQALRQAVNAPRRMMDAIQSVPQRSATDDMAALSRIPGEVGRAMASPLDPNQWGPHRQKTLFDSMGDAALDQLQQRYQKYLGSGPEQGALDAIADPIGTLGDVFGVYSAGKGIAEMAAGRAADAAAGAAGEAEAAAPTEAPAAPAAAAAAHSGTMTPTQAHAMIDQMPLTEDARQHLHQLIDQSGTRVRAPGADETPQLGTATLPNGPQGGAAPAGTPSSPATDLYHPEAAINGNGAAPTGRTVSLNVNGQPQAATLTDEQAARWDAAKTQYQTDLANLKQSRDQGILLADEFGKQAKSLAMRHTTELRQISGLLTTREQAAAAAQAAKITTGKNVLVTMNGQEVPAVVAGNPVYGKVKVTLEDGSSTTVPHGSVRVAPELPRSATNGASPNGAAPAAADLYSPTAATQAANGNGATAPNGTTPSGPLPIEDWQAEMMRHLAGIDDPSLSEPTAPAAVPPTVAPPVNGNGPEHPAQGAELPTQGAGTPRIESAITSAEPAPTPAPAAPAAEPITPGGSWAPDQLLAHLNLDPQGHARLAAQIQQIAVQPTTVSLDSMAEKARAIADVLRVDPGDGLTLDKKAVGALSGPEILARRNLVKENIDLINQSSATAADEAASPEARAQAADIVLRLDAQNNHLLGDIVTASSEKGRDLVALKLMAQNDASPEAYMLKAKQLLGDQPVTDEIRTNLTRLVNGMKEACGGE